MRILIVLIGLAAATSAPAAPIDFTTGISTSVVRFGRPGIMTDGANVDLPIWDHVLNKTYTAQIVPTGSSAPNSSRWTVEPRMQTAAPPRSSDSEKLRPLASAQSRTERY